MGRKEKLLFAVPKEDLLEKEPLDRYTTFRTGGPAEFLVNVRDEKMLQNLQKICAEEEIPFFLLGRGSNLLVSDKGFEGLVISTRKYMNRVSVDEKEGIVEAQAGAFLSAAASAALEAGLAGLEFASGIPGTVGGGILMNAGAYGGEIRTVLLDVRVLGPDGTIRTIPVGEAGLGYRTSRFQSTGEAILSAHFLLEKGDPAEIRLKMDDLNRRRREKQPLEYGSAGSTFKRPKGYFAGKLIEDCGLKGVSVGGAQVSEKHAGFVINKDHASSADVYLLCRKISDTVYEKTGVRLEREVLLKGDFSYLDERHG